MAENPLWWTLQVHEANLFLMRRGTYVPNYGVKGVTFLKVAFSIACCSVTMWLMALHQREWPMAIYHHATFFLPRPYLMGICCFFFHQICRIGIIIMTRRNTKMVSPASLLEPVIINGNKYNRISPA